MRSDQWKWTVSVDDEELGTFDKAEGGEWDSEATAYRPGGMGPQVSLGGFTSTGNITFSRLYELERDHANIGWLRSRRGKGKVSASGQPLDTDGNPFGSPLPYTGVLKRVKAPDHDSESSSAALLELEVVLDDA